MNKRYLILASILILAGVGLLILPEKTNKKELDPVSLLLAIDDPSRFLSADLVTEKIIQNDPALVLVDVRPKARFLKFSLPGAVNIPLDSVLTEASQSLFKQENKNKVFISDDDILADQAWQICKRQKYNNIFVLKGGINLWFNTIMNDNPPKETDNTKAFEIYAFRKAARQFFVGGSQQTDNNSNDRNGKEEVKLNKKSPAKSSGGGC